MARAIELKHSAGLCSALAHETSKMFTTAADALRTLDGGRVERWTRYLQLKAAVYTAYVSRRRGRVCAAVFNWLNLTGMLCDSYW